MSILLPPDPSPLQVSFQFSTNISPYVNAFYNANKKPTDTIDSFLKRFIKNQAFQWLAEDAMSTTNQEHKNNLLTLSTELDTLVEK